MAFRYSQKVMFQHCDPAGIVFYPRYLEMANATVETWFDVRLGHSFANVHGPMGGALPTASIAVTFHSPSRLGDDLVLALHLRRLGRSSAGLEFQASCGDELRFTMTSTLVYVGHADGRPQPWPDSLRTALQAEIEPQP